VDDEIDDYPEQFSQQTREALDLSVDALIEGLQRHAKLLSGMRGGSSEMPAVHETNAEVERLIAAWNERVSDHTGTLPVSLQGFDDEDDEELLEGEEAAELVDGEPLTVVSRWDLQVVDTDELMQAGREAHKRVWPDENDEDAAVAVPNVGQAVYALLHERREPWYDLPGIEVIGGARVFVRPIDPPTPLSSEDDLDEAIAEPPGERLFQEGWA
jgi:hypothetical protein